VHRARTRAYAHKHWSAVSVVEAVMTIIANNRRSVFIFVLRARSIPDGVHRWCQGVGGHHRETSESRVDSIPWLLHIVVRNGTLLCGGAHVHGFFFSRRAS
jgi:hypothetical protein